MNDIKQRLIEMIEIPFMNHNKYQQLGMKWIICNTSTKWMLNMGLDGNGKTMIAKAIADKCNIPYIYLKGEEVLNVGIGNTFNKARNIVEYNDVGCIIILDDLDIVFDKQSKKLDFFKRS